tara:strand:- start:153 stop:494 length:342 start_codon:yes stop_codon:yes gene_type:complete
MKSSTLKTLIKEAVKEAMQEELKEILLEAIKSPKQTIVESIQPQQLQQTIVGSPSLSSTDKAEAYKNIMGDIQSQYTSQDVAPKFNPAGAVPGGDLPQGNVDMSQIMGLMSSK